MSEDEYVHPKNSHAIRISYAMYRAFHAAMDKATESDPGDFDIVPDEMLRLLRSWGIEVVELWSRPNFPGPPTTPDWPDDGPND